MKDCDESKANVIQWAKHVDSKQITEISTIFLIF